MALRLLLAVALLLGAGYPAAAQTPAPGDAVAIFLDRIRDLALKGDSAGLAALTADGTNADEFVRAMTPAPSALVIKERDRTSLQGGGQRLLLEMFSARGDEARVFTWQMDVAGAAADPAAWRVARLDRLSIVSGLYRLSLDVARQFDVRNLTLNGPDLSLQMPSGVAFLATTPEGPTAIVLLGRGVLQFSPPDPSERTQVAIFSGAEQLSAEFEAVLVRLRPADFAASFAAGALTPRTAPVESDARRAAGYFDEYIGRTLNVDLNDLSRDRWSLLPQQGDLIAEVRTRKFGNLTYARSQSDAEDVSFFDRRRKKNIAIYASTGEAGEPRPLLQRRRRPRLRRHGVRPRRPTSARSGCGSTAGRGCRSGSSRRSSRRLTLRIADSLIVRSVHSEQLGRLMYLRVVGQNAVIVNFPIPVPRGTALTLQVVYGGRVESQELDREAITLDQEREPILLLPEPRYIYSNRSYWYPQGTVTDYATARLDDHRAGGVRRVASGTPAGPADANGGGARRRSPPQGVRVHVRPAGPLPGVRGQPLPRRDERDLVLSSSDDRHGLSTAAPRPATGRLRRARAPRRSRSWCRPTRARPRAGAARRSARPPSFSSTPR